MSKQRAVKKASAKSGPNTGTRQLRAIDKFDPNKGTAFTFVSQVVMNVLCTSVTNARNSSNRFTELSDSIVDDLVVKAEDRAAVDDITHRMKAWARTTLTDPRELSAQRWYVMSFTQDGFESRRHECANAAMAVYSLSHSRSRELYDLTTLEVRRVLYPVKRREPIAPGRLLGTRFAWMARYANLMNQDEFTKFVTLLCGLAPYLLLIIDPLNGNSHRGDRNPAISRRNIELIIHGVPNAVLLFNGNISDDKMTTYSESELKNS